MCIGKLDAPFVHPPLFDFLSLFSIRSATSSLAGETGGRIPSIPFMPFYRTVILFGLLFSTCLLSATRPPLCFLWVFFSLGGVSFSFVIHQMPQMSYFLPPRHTPNLSGDAPPFTIEAEFSIFTSMMDPEGPKALEKRFAPPFSTGGKGI